MIKKINRAKLPTPEIPSAEQIIRKEYFNTSNLLTPNIIRCGFIEKTASRQVLDRLLNRLSVIAYELSSGEIQFGYRRTHIFGVSLVEWNNWQTKRLEGRAFETLELAEEFIANGGIYEQTD